MTIGDGVTIDMAAATDAAKALADAGRTVQDAWTAAGPAIAAAEAGFLSVTGSDAEALRSWYQPQADAVRKAFPGIAQSFEQLGERSQQALGAFQDHDDNSAQQLDK